MDPVGFAGAFLGIRVVRGSCLCAGLVVRDMAFLSMVCGVFGYVCYFGLWRALILGFCDLPVFLGILVCWGLV